MDDKKEELQICKVGLDNFETMIDENYLYIDKTKLIYEMTKGGGSFYFLSRPRRFGKSLLCSTISNLFQGKRHLFKGLWIDDHWNWDRIHPVIHLEMGAGVADSLEQMNNKMYKMLKKKFKNHKLDIDPDTKDPYLLFKDLIDDLYEKTGKKLVILVDEYDKPIQEHVGEPIEVTMPKGNKGFLIEAIRDKLANFYVVLKEEGAKIEFLILTGVSKFAKVNIFSKLNNLNDITYDPQYATLCGYTHQELMDNYGPHQKRLANRYNLSREECEKKIKFWYNGYKFHDWAEAVFNPFSIVNLMGKGVFSNYWADSGTPTMLINSIKTSSFQLQSMINPKVPPVARDNLDLVNPDHGSFMLQTGYMTIKKELEYGDWLLEIPNYEVKRTFPLLVAQQMLLKKSKSETNSIGSFFRERINANDLQNFLAHLESMLNGIPYTLLKKKVHEDEDETRKIFNENYFHTIFYCLCLSSDINIRVEQIILGGIVDAVITTKTHFYIFEFKINRDPAIALAQIQDRSYYKPFLVDPSRELVIIGVRFDRETREVTASYRTLREKGSTTPSDGPLIDYQSKKVVI